MEHMAYCIRMREQGTQNDRDDLRPRCHGRAAMADAIIALAANRAFQSQHREKFDDSWFGDTAVPDWDRGILLQ
jgi:hypothetical protein